MIDTYATAIISLLKAGRELEFVLVNTKRVMIKRGHSSLYASVLKNVLVSLERETIKAKAKVMVTEAKQADSLAVKKSLAELGVIDNDILIEIDPTLIGGHLVTYNHRLLDQSYKTALKKLYQNITLNPNH